MKKQSNPMPEGIKRPPPGPPMTQAQKDEEFYWRMKRQLNTFAWGGLW